MCSEGRREKANVRGGRYSSKKVGISGKQVWWPKGGDSNEKTGYKESLSLESLRGNRV